MEKDEELYLLHLGGVSDGFELRVSGASHCGSVRGVSLAYGKGIGSLSYARLAGQMTGQLKSMSRVISLRLPSVKASEPLKADLMVEAMASSMPVVDAYLSMDY